MPWAFLLAAAAAAGPGPPRSAAPRADPVALVWVQAPDAATRARARAIGLGFAEQVDGDDVLMGARPEMLAALDRAGIRWRPAPPPPAGGRSAEAMLADLEALADSYPDLARFVVLGESVEGRPIAGLRIGASSAPRAVWRILGGHHGDETTATEVTFSIARHLVEAYGDDEALTDLLDRDAVWVVPHVNPDGVEAGSRYNAGSVDVNRNYSWQWSETEFASGPGPFSEPESRAVRALSAWTPFGAGLSMHAGEANIGWVWNYTTAAAPDEPLMAAVAGEYAAACGSAGFWTTNGADWYLSNGDSTDWAYAMAGALDFTVEVSRQKATDDEVTEALSDEHLPAVEAFLSWPGVVAGRVTDAATGEGIAAIVQSDGWWALATGPDGRFARPVAGGPVRVVARAAGWTPAVALLDPDVEEPVEIGLARDTLASIRPDPVILSQGGDGVFSLGREAKSVRLARPGEEPVAAEKTGDGWTVDPSALSPGPWDLEVDGAVAPRALFAGEVDALVEIEGVRAEGSTLAVEGGRFAPGSRAWAFSGEARAAVSLPVVVEAETALVIDAAALDDAPRPVDLLVLSNGRQVAAADVLGEVEVDTGEPRDTGDPPEEAYDPEPDSAVEWGPLTARGCATGGSYPGALALVTLAACSFRRRSR